ncbi:hypothetical protein [Coralloluteibacterium thermophilus]|uniref:Lipoprotein n=1 Tax=Coralloluteibacterium thermophilum TaxID=2707049 RepID=A0ABV9NML5_9GAMM
MNKILALAFAGLLAGCASTSAVESQQMSHMEPRVTYTTSRSVDEALECIETGVRPVTKSGHNVSTAEDGDARILWVTVLANPVIAVRVEPVEDGAYVEYRSRFKAGMANYTTAVLTCR